MTPALGARTLFLRPDTPRGGRAVFLAPPNAGSELADRLGESPWVVVAGARPLTGQLGTELRDLPGRPPLPPIPFGVIAGDRWIATGSAR